MTKEEWKMLLAKELRLMSVHHSINRVLLVVVIAAAVTLAAVVLMWGF